MPAGYQDLFLEQGTTFTTQLTLNDVTGVPYDLNNFTVKSQARTSYYAANATIIFVSSVFDANNGIIQLLADSTVTSNVSPRQKLVYDVIIKDNTSNTVTRVLEGQIFISPAVTK
jgi:hypothetical protein